MYIAMSEVRITRKFAYCTPKMLYSFYFRGDNFEKNPEYANTWKKDDDGGVVSDQPRITIGDTSMGPQGGYITR